MKLTYWHAECLTDANVYDIRTRTRKEAKARLADRDPKDYGPVKKVTIEYADAFDLMENCSLEDHHYWEYT